MGKRFQRRITKRLETKFSSSGLTFTGMSSNLSENGLFIRTRHGFIPGTILDIELLTPEGKTSFLKGKVRRTLKTQISTLRNGMGIELIEKDATYMDFIQSIERGKETTPEDMGHQEFHIIACPNCRVKNKISSEKLYLRPKCGKCGSPLPLIMS